MSSTALEFGLINTFRTGHVVLDALLCLLVPLVIQRVAQQLTLASLWSALLLWLMGDDDATTVTRRVESVQRFNQYGEIWDYEQKNHFLQKAISIHLAKILSFQGKNAKVDLVEKPKLAGSVDNDAASLTRTTTSCSSDDGYESDDYDYDTRVYRGEVYRLTPNALPPMNEWVKVTADIEFMHEIATPDSEGEDATTGTKVTESKSIFYIQSASPNGSTLIDTLVRTAFAEYQEEQRRQYKNDTKRYLYIQTGTKVLNAGEDGAASTAGVAYKRYALSEEKTFENLFFAEKQHVLQLLDHFTAKTDKFAMKGFPHKLGLLLHGPPGTGKTSLIKAVAQHTQRHIVTINLAKVQTNQELMDAVFDLKFAISGQDWPVELSFADVVFVLEDVDCASNVVASRQDSKSTTREEALAKRMRASQNKAEAGVKELVIGPPVKPKDSSSDKLNLSGLLNVLDGVIDCPGRIVIMTTNHPEKLDPALIRPGRINKQLLMDYMGWREIQQIVEYYCLTAMTSAQIDELRAICEPPGAKRLTPAEIEEFCAEFDDVDTILHQLRVAIGSQITASA